MTHRNTFAFAILLAALPTIGCASAEPTKQLVRARSLYQEAVNEAGNVQPEHVIEARSALKRAEAMHDEEPQSHLEKHLAYVAQRKALLAIARADYAKARTDLEQAEKSYLALNEAQRKQARERLESTQRRLEEKREALDSTEQRLSSTKSELEQERQKRQRLERKLAEAIEDLDAIAKIKSEEKKWTITLSGQVLFEFNEAKLMGVAEQRLDKVAEALKEAPMDKSITVYGYTDSIGTEEYNRKLSQDRADAVREYLVSQGLDSARIRAVGKGEQNPIADNSTPEGRANNRRVEIVVE